MIEKVLEAYEAKVTGRKTFMQKLAMMDTITKIVLGGVVIGAVLLFIIAFLVPAQIILIITSTYGAVIYIATLLLERMRRKKWKTNLKGYNNDLDLLAEILKEKDFNLYEKNKIKQLIRKYYQDIETQESKKFNSHPRFPFCKRVSHFESDLQILYPTFHFCNDFPVFSLAFMI